MLPDDLKQAIKNDWRTMYAIAKAAGVSRDAITRFLYGERDLTLTTAAKIATAVGLEWRFVAKSPAPTPAPSKPKPKAKRKKS